MVTVLAWIVLLGLGLPLALGFIVMLGDSTQGGVGPRAWTRHRVLTGFKDGVFGIALITLGISVIIGIVALLGWAGAVIAS
jgi:hypothetical protein